MTKRGGTKSSREEKRDRLPAKDSWRGRKTKGNERGRRTGAKEKRKGL